MKPILTILLSFAFLITEAQIEKQALIAPRLKANLKAKSVQIRPNGTYRVIMQDSSIRMATNAEILAAARQKRIAEVYGTGRDLLAAKYPIWVRDLILSEAVKDKPLFDAIIAYETALKAVYDKAVIDINAATSEAVMETIPVAWPQ